MKTPLSYYGGKQRLADTIVSMIPPHKIYIEPFFGGGGGLLHKKTFLSGGNKRYQRQHRHVLSCLPKRNPVPSTQRQDPGHALFRSTIPSGKNHLERLLAGKRCRARLGNMGMLQLFLQLNTLRRMEMGYGYSRFTLRKGRSSQTQRIHASCI